MAIPTKLKEKEKKKAQRQKDKLSRTSARLMAKEAKANAAEEVSFSF